MSEYILRAAATRILELGSGVAHEENIALAGVIRTSLELAESTSVGVITVLHFKF